MPEICVNKLFFLILVFVRVLDNCPKLKIKDVECCLEDGCSAFTEQESDLGLLLHINLFEAQRMFCFFYHNLPCDSDGCSEFTILF